MSAADGAARPDKLSIVVFSGVFDRVHYALCMASAALAANQGATLFFTMGGARALLADRGEGPGWRHLAPGEDGLAPLEADRTFGEKGLARFEELLEACIGLGATLMVCEMGLRAIGLDVRDLRPDVALTPGGLVTFLNDASARGAVVFI